MISAIIRTNRNSFPTEYKKICICKKNQICFLWRRNWIFFCGILINFGLLKDLYSWCFGNLFYPNFHVTKIVILIYIRYFICICFFGCYKNCCWNKQTANFRVLTLYNYSFTVAEIIAEYDSNIKIYKNIISSLALYGGKSLSCTLTEEHRLTAFDSSALRGEMSSKTESIWRGYAICTHLRYKIILQYWETEEACVKRKKWELHINV
jgi:hypothetical protein